VSTSAAWLVSELHSRAARPRRRLRGDRGEGVISAAIAVLIMAFLGAAMWFGFSQMMDKTECKVSNQVEQIGNAGAAPAAPGC
jgi:hypothetical protein